MLLLLLNYVVLRALWKIDVHLISTLVNKSLYYYKSYLIDETCGSLRSSLRTQYSLNNTMYFEDTPFLAALVYTSQHRIQNKAATSTENTWKVAQMSKES